MKNADEKTHAKTINAGDNEETAETNNKATEEEHFDPTNTTNKRHDYTESEDKVPNSNENVLHDLNKLAIKPTIKVNWNLPILCKEVKVIIPEQTKKNSLMLEDVILPFDRVSTYSTVSHPAPS